MNQMEFILDISTIVRLKKLIILIGNRRKAKKKYVIFDEAIKALHKLQAPLKKNTH